ncbi:PAP/OAS1 substrate-binding domain-containing protein [Basidiobolus meristosporus CBS 931.73]|uniref:polynucleotide adenylyltransferase n=1 Tax=Basidiobolus meristosporus CBS 931.73 TaxID=1314790 RepID=A0A1Y1Z8H4_9FUNG|nr:PAP/OAS1 substrate-binding domain-containing protein [Basidiobolus meristosporus CBS 931.73]|eukprot:ORY06553.1 PAP/OAS1 substrate-binding domain-containing protein [Basidiobolus meristosporus CBS 931.73]
MSLETDRIVSEFKDLAISQTSETNQPVPDVKVSSVEDSQHHSKAHPPKNENGNNQGHRHGKKPFHRGSTFGEQGKSDRSYGARSFHPNRGTGQYEGKRVLDKSDPRYLKARARFISVLTEQVSELYLKLTPSVEEVSRREQLYFRIHSICEELFPDAQLFQFGSTANGFGLKNADVDFCLCTAENSSLTAVAFVEQLGSVLKERGMENVMLLTRTRIPIIKLKDPVSELNCDIGFNNRLAVYNTRLLRMYAEVDSRVKEIVAIVKHWAKSRQINEPYLGTLSSYAYVLMIIFVLQQRGVLPCLQQICEGEKKEVLVDNYDAYFFDNITDLPKYWKSQNNESLGELLYEFFRFYASDFSYYGSVVSVRTGQVMSKEEKGWTAEATRESGASHVQDRYWVCIEDPFEVTHNLGRPVNKNSLYTIRGEFMRAANILGGTRTSTILERLCQVYVPEEEPPRAPPAPHERSN